MGKLILISGSNGSGKSLFAESLVRKTIGDRYYIATMVPQTEDNHSRIEKHRCQRKGLNFTTLEIPVQIDNVSVNKDGIVLLEDVSNLLANTVFGDGGSWQEVFEQICRLAERCRVLIAVTIADLSAADYEGETAAYIKSLETLNKALFDRADAAAEMKDGSPCWKKGSETFLE